MSRAEHNQIAAARAVTPAAASDKPAGLNVRSLFKRVWTALIYAVVLLGAVLLDAGPWWDRPFATGIVFGTMAAFAAAEFYALERREALLPNEVFGVVAAALMPLAATMWGLDGLSSVVTGLIAASLVWHVLFVRVRTADTALTVFGAVYTGFLLAYFVLVRSLEHGLVLSIVLLFSVWANDVAAYFVGSLLGKHRLAPHISPKKSIEGFFAGVGGSVAIWAVGPFIPGSGLDMVPALVTGLAVGVASVVGDLAESRMKREAGVKDSGTSLPGHGGFLDRLDSLILVCLVAYWVLHWMGIR